MFEEAENRGPMVKHYHGDTVRRFLVIGAVIMLATMPFARDLLPASFSLGLLAILAVGVFAGLSNPRQIWVAVLNLFISAVAFLVFEYVAVSRYIATDGLVSPLWFIMLNQVLALNFFAALYFGSKTLRGMILRRKQELLRHEENSL